MDESGRTRMAPQLKADLAKRYGKRFCTVDELAEITGISRPTVYEKMRRGEIPYDDAARNIFFLRDYESRGILNLKNVGAWRYATHPSTDVLCCAYAVDDGPVQLWVP